MNARRMGEPFSCFFRVRTCLSQILCRPPLSTTCARYLPSGEIAARKAFPVVVNLVSFTDSNGGRELRRQKTTDPITTDPAITANAGQRNCRFNREDLTPNEISAAGGDSTSIDVWPAFG